MKGLASAGVTTKESDVEFNQSSAGKDEDDDDSELTKESVEGFKQVLEYLGVDLDDEANAKLLDLEASLNEEEEDDFDYSAGGDVKTALMWVAGGVVLSNIVAIVLLFTGTFQDPDGATAMQNFYAGYLLELTLSLDNLFAFYLIFKFFQVRSTEAVERTLWWGILGAMVLRAVVVAIGVVAIKQSECVLFLAAIVLLWTAFTVFVGEDEEDDDLSDNGIIKFCKRFLPVTHEYDGANFFTETPEGMKMTPLMLVNVVINLSDIAFAMDSVPAVFGITDDGVVVWTSSLCAILALRSLYTVTVHYVTDMPYMNQAIGIVLFFIAFKLLGKIMFHFDLPVTLSLLVVAVILSIGFVASYYKKKADEEEEEGRE
jgi:TerC family integral membrane protein